jgi:hypothetical protein
LHGIDAVKSFDAISNCDGFSITGCRWEGNFQNVSHTGVDIFLEFIEGQKDQNYFILFYKKKIVGMVATCCQIAYEPHISKQINHSNTQGTKHTY